MHERNTYECMAWAESYVNDYRIIKSDVQSKQLPLPLTRGKIPYSIFKHLQIYNISPDL